MSKRINVILPEATVRVLDRVAPKGNRSRLISDAVIHYGSARGKSNLAEQLKAGALRRKHRRTACVFITSDVPEEHFGLLMRSGIWRLPKEWFPLEEDTWKQQAERAKSPKK